jgi:hypothetical protein
VRFWAAPFYFIHLVNKTSLQNGIDSRGERGYNRDRKVTCGFSHPQVYTTRHTWLTIDFLASFVKAGSFVCRPFRLDWGA